MCSPIKDPLGSQYRRTVRRYRCSACGNLTRFDVTISRRSRAYHHYTVGGELTVEDEQVLEEVIETVSCRWCGNGRAVEVVTDGVTGDVADEVGR